MKVQLRFFIFEVMTPKRQWEPDRMKNAVEAVRKRELGFFKASRIFNVPQTTLERYVIISGSASPNAIERNPMLCININEDLSKYCVLMEHNCYGLTTCIGCTFYGI